MPNHILKYTEYVIRKYGALFTTDLRFHTRRLSRITGRRHNLKKPVTLSEKICHRMIFDRNPHYTFLADKFSVREYVHYRTPYLKLAPLLGVYTSANEIDFNHLPDRFVLKCNHDCGSTVICTSKENLNRSKVISRLNLALKKNMYYTTREWQYKDILPVILCEEYIDLFSGQDRRFTPEMLRIHCFHGVASFIEADFTDEQGEGYINVYDRAWRLQPFQMEFPNTPYEIAEPAILDNAITAAQALSKGIDYCRIDLMPLNNELYFSEITLSPRRGKLKITPAEWDEILGAMWQ